MSVDGVIINTVKPLRNSTLFFILLEIDDRQILGKLKIIMIICIENSFLRLNSGQLPVDSSDEPYTMNNPCNKQSILILYIFYLTFR